MDISIIYGLIAMFSWGLADFIQSTSIRKIGTPMVMMLRNILTLTISIALGIVLAWSDQINAKLDDLSIIVTSSVLYVIGYVFFMRGFELGKTSVVAPISSAYAIVTVTLSIFIGGESIELLQFLAIIIMIVGVFYVSSGRVKPRLGMIWKEKGLRETFLAIGFIGTAFYVAGFASQSIEAIEAFFYAALTQSIAFLVMSYILGARPQKLINLSRRLFGIFVIHVLFSNIGWAAFLFGTSTGSISIVTSISSISTGVTAILAIMFMHERLVFMQYFGVVTILIGVFVISLW